MARLRRPEPEPDSGLPPHLAVFDAERWGCGSWVPPHNWEHSAESWQRGRSWLAWHRAVRAHLVGWDPPTGHAGGNR